MAVGPATWMPVTSCRLCLTAPIHCSIFHLSFTNRFMTLHLACATKEGIRYSLLRVRIARTSAMHTSLGETRLNCSDLGWATFGENWEPRNQKCRLEWIGLRI